ncbi:ADP/ATP carrier protein [Elasticomyces elasticus]|nr:ADP/ATP carrier protein [Elasticomyces elasticus]
MAAQSKEAVIPPWGLAVAGATGAVLANALVYPLDIAAVLTGKTPPNRVKTRLQVQVKRRPQDGETTTTNDRHYTGTAHAIRSIVQDEGLSGLYAGIAGSLLGVASTNFAYFYWYSVVRTLYLSQRTQLGQAPGTAVELSLGAAAGAVAQLFTIPIAVVTTRQQTQPKGEKKGLLDTAREVVDSDDGWTGLWRGMKASLVLVVNPAITYGAYQRLRELIYPGRRALRPHEAFLLGALSKSLATLLTHPLIVAKVGLQSRPPPSRNGVPFRSFVEVLRHIVRTEGLLAIFKGIGPQILKGVLVQGLLMMTKERVELLFVLLFAYVRRVRREELSRLRRVVEEGARRVGPVVEEGARRVVPGLGK